MAVAKQAAQARTANDPTSLPTHGLVWIDQLAIKALVIPFAMVVSHELGEGPAKVPLA
jgi:hypothetical protein